MSKLKIALLDSHPIQYHAPWFRALAAECDLHVLFAHHQSRQQQAQAGYGVEFDWDVDLTSGYAHTLLTNVAREPNVFSFAGCDTPDVGEHIAAGAFDAVIVSGWYLKSYWQATLACRRLGVPTLARGDSRLGGARSALKLAAKRLAYPPALRMFDGFLAVGLRNTEYLRHYGVPNERIHFVPRFVDSGFFAAQSHLDAAARAARRAELGASAGDCVALFVGRFLSWKRPLDLLHAIAASPHKASTVAAFAGAGVLHAEIERTGAQLGVRTALIGFQNQSQLPAVYAAADMLVLPSSAEETWGLVVNEAMACGRPAITSDAVGCAPDLIDSGRTGFAYPVGDVQALAHALERTRELVTNPRLAANLRAKMAAYSAARAVAGTLAAVESVID